jgi:hypothetical protein
VAVKAGMDGPWYWALPEHEAEVIGLAEESTNSAKSVGQESLHPMLPSMLPSEDDGGEG